MCWTFFKNLFKKKEEITEEEIIEGTIENEKDTEVVVPEPEIEEPIEETIPALPPTPEEDALLGNGQKDLVVLIDNGHASSTPGKYSPLFEDGTRFYEWKFNRDVVAALVPMLEKENIKHEIITPEENYDVKLNVRATRANSYCKKYGTANCLFISVHGNAFGNGTQWEKPGGWSVWTSRGETKADPIAKLFYEEAEKILPKYGFTVRNGVVQGGGNAGPDYEDNFTVLVRTSCPAILTENLFYTNRKEVEWMKSEEGINAIALIHLNGIKRVIAERKK